MHAGSTSGERLGADPEERVAMVTIFCGRGVALLAHLQHMTGVLDVRSVCMCREADVW